MATYREIASFILGGVSFILITSGLNSNLDNRLIVARERGEREKEREGERERERERERWRQRETERARERGGPTDGN